MKAKCHACGREYLVARIKAGVAVRCRGCGAMNDGAGGAPPPQTPPAAARRRREAATPVDEDTILGTGFVLGGAPPLPERRVQPIAAQGAATHPRRRGALGLVGRIAAVLVVIGALAAAFIHWRPLELLGKSRDPRTAVAQIAGDGWRGNAFLTELDGRCWLVTHYLAVENIERIDVIFRSVETGDPVVELTGLPLERFRMQRGFLEASRELNGLRDAGVIVYDVTDHRERFERAGIRPLEVVGLEGLGGGESLVCYAHEISDEFGEEIREGDDAIDGMGVHVVRGGSVVRVKRDASGPSSMQTTVPYQGGMIGAPLFVDGEAAVVAIMLEAEWDLDRGVPKVNSSIAIDAARIREAIADDSSLESVRASLERLAPERNEWVSGGEIELEWPNFSLLDSRIVELQEQGWSYTQSTVGNLPRGVSSRVALSTKGVRGEASEVYLLAFAAEPLVDLDLEDIELSGIRGIGSDYSVNQGGICGTPIRNPTTGELLPLAPGTVIDIPISAYFAGRPISARCSIVMLERPVGLAPAQPQASESGASSGVEAPLVAGGSIASTARVMSAMTEELFASSLIGLSAFEDRYLRFPFQSGGMDQLRREFIDPPKSGQEVGAGAGGEPGKSDVRVTLMRIREVSLVTAPIRGKRPYAKIELVGVPAGSSVQVFLEVEERHGEFVSATRPKVVSRGDGVVVGDTLQPPDGIFLPEDGLSVLALDIPWNIEGLRRMQSAVNIPYQLSVRYEDGSIDQLSGTWTIHPPSEVEQGYPFELGFATMVDETHPWIRQLVSSIQNDAAVRDAGLALVGSGGGIVDQAISLGLIWRELLLRGVNYQNLTGAAEGAQRVRQVHESLGDNAANCIDGAVLLASVGQAIGIESSLVLVPGHAFVLFDLREGDRLWSIAVECTKLGDRAERLERSADGPLFDAIRTRHPFLRREEFAHFEYACHVGWERFEQELDETSAVVDPGYDELVELASKTSPSEVDRERFDTLSRALRNQMLIVPIPEAKKLGVRPVGAPSNLPPLPPRPRN